MKYYIYTSFFPTLAGRSREGAWIEIAFRLRQDKIINVAPVRERGLKFFTGKMSGKISYVAPVRERGLKSVHACTVAKNIKVAPVRERGLKLDNRTKI